MGHRKAALTSFAFLLVLAGCDTKTDTPTGPTPVAPCQMSFTLQQSSVSSGGGTGVVSVSASQPQCGWTATSEVPWIGFTPPSGFGGGNVQFNVASNPSPGARQGDIILNETRFRITQAGSSCDVQLSATSQAAPSGGMSGTVVVTTGSSCAWEAVSNVGWLIVTSDQSVVGEGAVQFTAEPNPNASSRTGLIAIGNRLFTVTQAAK